jgi:hypothetical protein
MTVRPLDLRDLPTLFRYRGETISLDSTRLLTRGNPLSAAGLLSYINPARHLYTAINPENGTTLAGGILHTNGDMFARLTYIAPTAAVTHPGMTGLIEHLTAEAGKWGAFHILAEIDEASAGYTTLRTAGFSVYAWQRLWEVSHIDEGDSGSGWTRASSVDLPAIQSLHHQIVPPLLQPVEPTPRRAAGLICPDGSRCYASLSYGVHGIVITPLIHPEASNVTAMLTGLLSHLPDRRKRPVYLCVRSYQAWLESALEELGGKPSERQAVMMKHLAHLVKDEQVVLAAQPAQVGVQPSHMSHIKPKE